jgi:uncharacterized membrane protein
MKYSDYFLALIVVIWARDMNDLTANILSVLFGVLMLYSMYTERKAEEDSEDEDEPT